MRIIVPNFAWIEVGFSHAATDTDVMLTDASPLIKKNPNVFVDGECSQPSFCKSFCTVIMLPGERKQPTSHLSYDVEDIFLE